MRYEGSRYYLTPSALMSLKVNTCNDPTASIYVTCLERALFVYILRKKYLISIQFILEQCGIGKHWINYLLKTRSNWPQKLSNS